MSASMARPATAGSGLNVGVRTVVALGQLGMPAAFAVLELDMGGLTGNVLFRGHPSRGGEGGGLVAEWFREHVVELIGPATVVLDDLVVNFRHDRILTASIAEHGSHA